MRQHEDQQEDRPYEDWKFTGVRPGRPAIGPTVKASMPQEVVDLLDWITKNSSLFTAAYRDRTQNGHRVPIKDWPRAEVIALIVAAGAPQFAYQLLGKGDAFRPGTTCPLCYGFVDGPHGDDCGYFGPGSEQDPHFEQRLRRVLNIRRRAAVQYGEGNWTDSPI